MPDFVENPNMDSDIDAVDQDDAQEDLETIQNNSVDNELNQDILEQNNPNNDTDAFNIENNNSDFSSDMENDNSNPVDSNFNPSDSLVDSNPDNSVLDQDANQDNSDQNLMDNPLDNPDVESSPLEGQEAFEAQNREDSTKDDAMARDFSDTTISPDISDADFGSDLDFDSEFDEGLDQDGLGQIEEEPADFQDITQENDTSNLDNEEDINQQNNEDTVNDLQDMLSDYLENNGEGDISGEDIATEMGSDSVSDADVADAIHDIASNGSEAANDLLESIGNQADSIFENGLDGFADALADNGVDAQTTENLLGRVTDSANDLTESQASYGNVGVTSDADGQTNITNPDDVSSASQVADNVEPNVNDISNDTQMNQVVSDIADNPDLAQNYLDGDGNVDLDAIQDSVSNLVDSDPSMFSTDDGVLNSEAVQDALEAQQANAVDTGLENALSGVDAQNANNNGDANPYFDFSNDNQANQVDDSQNYNDFANDNAQSYNDFDDYDDWHDFAAGE